MIYLDAVGFKFLTQELKQNLGNSRINKIVAYDASSFSLFCAKKQLYFENKKEAIVFLKEDKIVNTNFESKFSILLKKYIMGAIIRDIYIKENDRIIVFEIEKLNMLGELERTRLIFEFLSKMANVVLVDKNDKIIANMFTNITMDRNLIANSNYVYPEKVSPYGKYMKDLDEEKRMKFEKKYEAVLYSNNLFSYNKFLDLEYESFSSLNEGLNEYFRRNNNISVLENKKKNIRKYIKNNIKRLEKIIEKIPIDLEENRGYEIFKEDADVLTSNMYLIKDNADKIELFNYYTNENKIYFLDKNLSVSKNIQKLYDKYAKAKRREKSLENRKKEVENELFYYKEQQLFLENEMDIIGVEQIEEQFITLSKNKLKSTRNSKRALQFEEFMGYRIYIGRNSVENEKITFEIAGPKDIWFHAKDIAGSHVVIKGYNPPREVIIYAAKLAAKNSKSSGWVDVDYTLKKNVKKIPGAKKGQVIYNEYSSLRIDGEE